MAPDTSTSTSTSAKHIVIIGGGIIGTTTAYYLTRHPAFSPTLHTITLLESTALASGASGKAGGLLALWAYPASLVPLSFRLHKELAEEHGGRERWGYRGVGVGQVEAKARPLGSASPNGGGLKAGAGGGGVSLEKNPPAPTTAALKEAGFPPDLDWLAPESAVAYAPMAGEGETAQVHPYHFTAAMAALAADAGARIVCPARAVSLNPAPSSKGKAVASVTYTTPDSTTTSTTIPATDVIVAAGPWTPRLLPDAPVAGLRAHSVTIRPTREVSAHALFTHIALPAGFRPGQRKGASVAPEIYARPGREVYACGEGDRLVPLPGGTGEVEVDEGRCREIVEYVGSISDELRDGEVTARQACYLPVSDGAGGGPYVGEVAGWEGVVVAAGHSCWGVQNAPATGKVVAEIVMEGAARSVKLGGLDPKRWW